MKPWLLQVLFLAIPLLAHDHVAFSQTPTLAKPSRTVYKCNTDGKVVYTDEPCVGAQLVDVEPTRGLNKSTGKELSGEDVSRERRREQLAEAVKPLTGMTPAQFEIQRRRVNLSPAAKAECGKLDTSVPQAEAEERAAAGESKSSVQRNLFALRKRQRALGC